MRRRTSNRIYKRGDRWHADLRLHDGTALKRCRLTLGRHVQSERQAVEEADRIVAQNRLEQQRARLGIDDGALPAAAFSGFAKKWLDTFVGPHRTPSVYSRYEGIIRVHLVPYFGDRPISSITTLNIEEFIAHSKTAVRAFGKKPEFIGPKTINEHVGTLSSMFSKAVKWGYLRANPCQGVSRLKVPEHEIEFYTEEETASFLRASRELDPDFYGVFLVGFRTGLRLGELLALRWDHINFETNQMLSVQSYHRGNTGPRKDKKSVWLPLHPDVVDFLRQHKGERDGLVFHTEDGGGHLNRDILKRPFDRAWMSAGLHRITIHGMRHSFISQLVIRNVPMAAISKLVGHSAEKITARYSHVRPSDRQNYVNMISSLCPEKSTDGNVIELHGPARRAGGRKARV